MAEDDSDWFERALAEEADSDDEIDSADEVDSAEEADSADEVDSAEEADSADEVDSDDEADSAEEIDSDDEVDIAEEVDIADEVDSDDEISPHEAERAEPAEPRTGRDRPEEDQPMETADSVTMASDEPDREVRESAPVDSAEPPAEQYAPGEEPLDIDLEGGESFGFDVGGGGEDMEAGEYHTDLPRIDIGIEGLDEMIREGVPERSLISVIGGAGTGKTTFALQFLQKALESGDKGVFITLEESHDRVIQSAAQKGWDFEGAEAAGELAVLDLDPVDMANSLTSIRNELPRLVGAFGADRLVLDSVSLLEMMYDEQATRRTEIYDFARSLKGAGVTTLLTSEASSETPYASRFGIIEYLTDAVFILQYIRPEDFQETRLSVEIQKIRDANHARETKPYEITNTGISVYRDATIF